MDTSMNLYMEKHRPQLHFSLPEKWMNDPNGLVFHNDTYHLFYQHNPFCDVWGPMHWGHAVSKDLVTWSHLPIALFPDELGTIFSGCVIVDERNAAGFQKETNRKTLIAIFTQHLENSSSMYLQRQSLAYSIDNGVTWKMYENNPIIENCGEKDFRDPKVIEYNNHFIMCLAVGNRIKFYRSYNLLDWIELSEFGVNEGAHDGVWECPDLFPLQYRNNTYWVLLVSINPGGPNKGSATQYFIGNFDGEVFTNYNSSDTVLWLDYGPDSYAGGTWNSIDSRSARLFISWMNNWDYGQTIPTKPWRGQMSIPRTLTLMSVNENIYLCSKPIALKPNLLFNKVNIEEIEVRSGESRTLQTLETSLLDIRLIFDITNLCERDSFELCFENERESVCVGFNYSLNNYYIDRSNSGIIDFDDKFTVKPTAARHIDDKIIFWHIIVDVSSIEVFADNGLTVMTSIFFCNQKFTEMRLKVFSNNADITSMLLLKESLIIPLETIWNPEIKN
ncbi:hypothetical protein B4U80_09801 [Leptotrombidium deliense]|uniref:Uncharacterized protein n=1 Tax=Leptotrombidium deliense TaxID=299467 RepID=A0A443S862_9ACAR|nr:hypothetical protein B4U80_09801 [Leptotrombidium deliense]